MPASSGMYLFTQWPTSHCGLTLYHPGRFFRLFRCSWNCLPLHYSYSKTRQACQGFKLAIGHCYKHRSSCKTVALVDGSIQQVMGRRTSHLLLPVHVSSLAAPSSLLPGTRLMSLPIFESSNSGLNQKSLVISHHLYPISSVQIWIWSSSPSFMLRNNSQNFIP